MSANYIKLRLTKLHYATSIIRTELAAKILKEFFLIITEATNKIIENGRDAEGAIIENKICISNHSLQIN